MSKPIETIEEFIAKTEKLEGRSLLYRGLADATWEVSASAYRRIKTSSEEALPPPRIFQNYMKQLLDSAGLRGFRDRQGRSHSDLELLAELQHHGSATCLIDFTTNALVALWFACREELDKDGKVAAMATDNTESFSTVSYQDLERPIEEFLYKDKRLWKWEPSHLSNRIVAQQSIFVFGEGIIEERHYEKIRIDKNNKGKIREELEKRFGITERHLFSDFTGFALSNAQNRPYRYTAEDYFYLGMELHQQRNFQKAKNYYDQAIELDPQYDAAYNGRGDAKRVLGDCQGSIKDYDQAIRLNPQYALFYYNRGNAKYDLRDYQGAIKDHDQAIGLNPRLAVAYINRGNAKYALRDYQGSIKDYDQAIELIPQYALSYYNRGNAKNALGDHQGAIKDYGQAIELDPQYALSYYNRGNAKNALGDYQGANKDWEIARTIDPNLLKV